MDRNIEIADFVIIGANSVVVKSILEPGCIAAGVHARIIRKLSNEEMERIKKGRIIIINVEFMNFDKIYLLKLALLFKL